MRNVSMSAVLVALMASAFGPAQATGAPACDPARVQAAASRCGRAVDAKPQHTKRADVAVMSACRDSIATANACLPVTTDNRDRMYLSMYRGLGNLAVGSAMRAFYQGLDKPRFDEGTRMIHLASRDFGLVADSPYSTDELRKSAVGLINDINKHR